VGRAAEVKYKAPGRVIVRLLFLLSARYCHCVLVRVCGTTFHFVVSLPLDFLAILRCAKISHCFYRWTVHILSEITFTGNFRAQQYQQHQQ
jgi:hypothetical protein